MAGSMNWYPFSFSFSMFPWTMLLSHIFVFMEGTKRTGTLVAITMVVRKSSAMPFATFPITLAVAGAITIWSAMSERAIWPILPPVKSSNISWVTGLPEMV